ncbi:hypothetical protein [Aeromonas australiensis]|uniref:hypothetical protein n=1 Tax=Aeromonas australiensis TaxID=1114880 RepID=UPI003CC7AE64
MHTVLCGIGVTPRGAVQVDVNEQNEQAVDFYLKMEFTVTGRSPGKLYPLLHMALAPN